MNSLKDNWKEIIIIACVIIFFMIIYIWLRQWIFTETQMSVDNYSYNNWSTYRVATVLNEDTGVYYAITDQGYITPMYNPDGTLLTKEKE